MSRRYASWALQSLCMSPFRSLSEEGGPCRVGDWACHRAPKSAEFWGAVPLWENLVFAHLSFLLLPLQAGMSCGAESQISDESCQKISPLQRKQRKTTSWWGFPGEGKVKSSLLLSTWCLKMAVLQRENVFFPLGQSCLWCERQSVCAEHKDTDRPEAWTQRTQSGYGCYFHRSFGWAERGLERRKKIKSLFYKHRKEMWSGLNSKQGLEGSLWQEASLL